MPRRGDTTHDRDPLLEFPSEERESLQPAPVDTADDAAAAVLAPGFDSSRIPWRWLAALALAFGAGVAMAMWSRGPIEPAAPSVAVAPAPAAPATVTAPTALPRATGEPTQAAAEPEARRATPSAIGRSPGDSAAAPP